MNVKSNAEFLNGKLANTLVSLLFLSLLAFNANALTCPDLDGSYVYSQEYSPVYLGFFGSQYASESIMYEYGSYGSPYGVNSVRNEYGTYGSPYRTYSATNEYTSTPPIIYKNGSAIGYLTANPYKSSGVSLPTIDTNCTFYSSVPSSSTPPPSLPAPPTEVEASDGTYTDKIVVTWSSVSAATSYNVYYSESLGSSKSLLGQFTATSISATGTGPGEVWYFWVYSVNANGESATGSYDPGHTQSEVTTPADLALNIFDAVDGTYAPGEDLVVHNKIENIGGTNSDSYRITFYASTDTSITTADYSFGYIDRNALGVGENHNYNTTLTLPLESLSDGNYFIGGILTVSDSDSGNNSKYDTTPISLNASFSTFQMNAGLNDAWYDPETDGQGFFITVFPDLEIVSVAWFTYDTELPPDDATANLGDPGHRWVTAAGKFTDNQAILNITITSGGIFDTPTELQRTDPPGSDGTLTLTFDSCNSATVEYDIPPIDQRGIVFLQRVANDNIMLCETLNAD